MIEKINAVRTLPDGFRASPLLPEYEQGAVDVLNAYFRWLNNSGNVTTISDMQNEWKEEGFNPETDTCVVLAPDGRVVGYNDVWSVNALNVRMFSWMGVQPELLDSGITDHLVDWAIQRSRENVAKAPQDTRVVLHMSANASHPEVYDILLRHGLNLIRHSYRMRIEFDQPPALPVVPDGIVIRPMIVGKEERDAAYADYEAFLDHWGFVEEPFEKFYERFLYRQKTDPHYDPSLFFIAVDGDQIAGVSLCEGHVEEEEGLAWVGSLGVRRPWRKRGLGLALLRHSFNEFYRRGITRAGLGVDAENITGAVRLYEKAGMRVWRKNSMFELELREGKDLMRQSQ